MKTLKFSAFLFVLLLAGCTNTTETLPPCKEYSKADLEMLDLIDQIKEENKEDMVFLKAFDEAQIYWVQYRNRQVKAVFPLSPRKYDFNVGDCKCEIYSDLTKLRIEELRKWVVGVPEGNCAGTYNKKRD